MAVGRVHSTSYLGITNIAIQHWNDSPGEHTYPDTFFKVSYLTICILFFPQCASCFHRCSIVKSISSKSSPSVKQARTIASTWGLASTWQLLTVLLSQLMYIWEMTKTFICFLNLWSLLIVCLSNFLSLLSISRKSRLCVRARVMGMKVCRNQCLCHLHVQPCCSSGHQRWSISALKQTLQEQNFAGAMICLPFW